MINGACGRRVGHLLLTGVPGWLTEGLAASLGRDPLPGLAGVRYLVQPGVPFDREAFARRVGLEAEPVAADLRDADGVRAALRGIDTCIHAAGVIHVRRIREFFEVNTDGTRRLAEAAATSGVGRFVFVSSNAAGGSAHAEDRPLTEEDPARPRSAYGLSKWRAEEALAAVAGPMERVVLRPCMFYGPPVPERHVDVYRRLLTGRLPLVGSGRYARSVTHIDHLVQACRLAAVHPSAAGRTYYVADREVHTTRGIVEAMARALGVSPRFLPLPAAVGPVAHACDAALTAAGIYWQNLHLVGESTWHVGVSIERARRELGYSPEFDLDHGLRAAVAWCRERDKLPPEPRA
ncbi:MAG: NAD-dependent epimerase/dehydratase family protein [Planctomycetes bacterium]|nr:NAD-dependent epimerase/dehydratase family protein [Planctomycetota bacterium]